jgi:hypothetical protein
MTQQYAITQPTQPATKWNTFPCLEPSLDYSKRPQFLIPTCPDARDYIEEETGVGYGARLDDYKMFELGSGIGDLREHMRA